MTVVEVALLVLMFIGVIGIILPVLPGLVIIVLGVLVWAVDVRSTTGWVLLGVALAMYLAGVLLQWAIPGRRMQRAGVSTSTLLIGIGCAIVGMFVIPVVGLFVGFPVGIFLVSLARTRNWREAARLTGHAIRAVGTNILIELLTGFTIIAAYVVTVVFIDR